MNKAKNKKKNIKNNNPQAKNLLQNKLFRSHSSQIKTLEGKNIQNEPNNKPHPHHRNLNRVYKYVCVCVCVSGVYTGIQQSTETLQIKIIFHIKNHKRSLDFIKYSFIIEVIS